MATDLYRMDGRVVIITGGSQGLGEAAATLLRDRGAAGLVLVGRDQAKGDAAAARLSRDGCRAVFVVADLSDAAACEEVVARADAAFGVVHGVVNAAASTARGTVWDTTVALFDDMFAVNVRAPFLIMQGAARIMVRERVSGSMVTIGSVSGHGGQPFITAYCASKGALQALTRNFAYSVMRDRIRVNLLNLGWMDTPAEHAIQTGFHGAPANWLAEAEAGQPMGRLIKVDEAARAICFLLSDESGMMTGTIVDYDQSVLGAGDAPKPPPELHHS